MTNVTNNVTINIIGGDSALRTPWFTDYGNPSADDEGAPADIVFEFIGSFSKETVLTHLKLLCQRDKSIRDAMFWELLQNTKREENPYNDTATPEPARSSSDKVIIDLTTNPPKVQQQSNSRKRKLEVTAEHTSEQATKTPRRRGGILCGQCNEFCTKQMVEKGDYRYHKWNA